MRVSPDSGALVWLRNDLRLSDHAAFGEAARRGPYHAVYVFDPRQFAVLPHYGWAKTGPQRARFLIECVAALRTQLRAQGGDLIVRFGAPERVLPVLAQSLGAGVIIAQAGAGTEERAVEHALAAAVDNRPLHLLHDHTLLAVHELPFEIDAVPETFTAFRIAVERLGRRFREPQAVPTHLPQPYIESGELPALADLGLVSPAIDPRATLRFTGGSAAAHARMRHYIWEADRLRVYKQTRNGMLNPDDASRLSPWLAHGCLSAREVADEVRQYEQERVRNDSTAWLIFELLWRDYFHFILLKHGARLFQRSGLQGLRLPWRDPAHDPAARRDFDAWASGQTGFPLLDANQRELATTGYMSNRGRQNSASFLSKNLNIDWRWGAAWFEHHLLDYDVASNYGNWCYAAGVGNDARGFRFFNLHKQAQDYDPNGDYVRHWLPELAGLRGAQAHRPELASPIELARAGVKAGSTYPRPMVDLFESARENEALYRCALQAGREAGRRDA